MSLASEKNWLSQNTRFYLCHTFLFFFFDFFLFFCIDVFMQCAALFPSISSCSPQKSRQMSCLFIEALSFSRRLGVCFAHFFSCPERDNGPRFHLCAIYAFLSYANALRKSPSLVNVHLLFTSPLFFFSPSSSSSSLSFLFEFVV